jgi:hypothetical protein
MTTRRHVEPPLFFLVARPVARLLVTLPALFAARCDGERDHYDADEHAQEHERERPSHRSTRDQEKPEKAAQRMLERVLMLRGLIVASAPPLDAWASDNPPLWNRCALSLVGRVLINAQIAAGYALKARGG